MSVVLATPPKRDKRFIKLSPDHKSLDAELCGLGQIRRHITPPSLKGSGELDVSTPRRKRKDHLKSHIFDTGGEPLSFGLPKHLLPSTHDRIFAVTPPKTAPPFPRYQRSMKKVSLTPGSESKRDKRFIKLSPLNKSLDAELCGLGGSLRHIQPPGGKENGVFDAYRLPPEVTSRRKIKDHQKSHVFDAGEPSSPPRPIKPRLEVTQERIFPEIPPKYNPPRHNNMKSTLFQPEPPRKSRYQLLKRNPITGEGCKAFDESRKYKDRKIRNPITAEGIKDSFVRSRCTQPPGGKSTLVLEYQE